MFEESVPESAREAGEICACAHALAQLACVAAVDVIPADEEPSGYATIEATIPPDYIDERSRAPGRVTRTVTDPDAPWSCRPVELVDRAPGTKRLLVR